MSLSDPFCVGRYRDEFLHLAEHQVDLLFANELEILSLYQVDHFEDAVKKVKGHCEVAILTRSEKGCVIVSGDDVITLSAHPAHPVVDTTGAGDLFAAGFLYGYTQDKSLRDCGIMGNLIASEIITHRGARPDINLKDFLEQNMPV